MKTLVTIGFFALIFFSIPLQAAEKEWLHDMHAMMHSMDVGLSQALEGSDLQMLGQMGISKKLDKDMMTRGTRMVKDGKAMIKEMLEGEAMKRLHKEGGYDKKIMDDIHELGDRMLKVIEQIEKLHEGVEKQK
ncbi:MAG: hypothetical protein HY756_01040 [Nitrospirae bacterium]|nr:hypothetical protein [Nitrospirota bacterium]